MSRLGAAFLFLCAASMLHAQEKLPLIKIVATGGTIAPQKARVLLMLALTVTRDPAELQRIFATY